MKAGPAEISADLPCHRCGYDLRAHAQDAKCPECGESVAESRRVALIPRRPAWRDSDPRWRRRMLAGVSVLTLMPLIDVLQVLGWASSVPVPTVSRQAVSTVDQTFLYFSRVDQPVLFCIGVVLLFSKERGRRRSRLDWTRRWGVLCSYVTLLLSAVPILYLAALVAVGISALLMSMPLRYQPQITRPFVEVSTAYLRYGPYPRPITAAVLVAFSSLAILLACVALFDALRSSGPKRLAAILLAPLALFSVIHVAGAALFCIGSSGLTSTPASIPVSEFPYGAYFRSSVLVGGIASFQAGQSISGREFTAFIVEATKWCDVFAIAIWLTLARLGPWRRGKGKRSAPSSAANAGQVR